MLFRDREDAGRRLAARLEQLRDERPVVLGLARGGLPVAFEVARAIDAPLEVLVVRKLGAPGFPEYAIGALAEGGVVYVNREAVREVGASEEEVAALAEREAVELSRRVRAYRGGRPLPELAGRTVVLVDDGIATGATARAAARAARAGHARRVILAAPVAAADTAAALREECDEVVALELPLDFVAVGYWYQRFEQLSDADVTDLLRRAHGEPPEAGGEPWDGSWTGADPEPPPREPEVEFMAIPFSGGDDGPGALEASLAVPEGARGLVVFVHGSGSSRRSPRNRYVAAALQRAGLATLLVDLLTAREAAEDAAGRRRPGLPQLAGRISSLVRWLGALPRTHALPIGLFGAGAGAAVALAAAAQEAARVGAVVARAGRLDLLPEAELRRVHPPVLLLAGRRDERALAVARAALASLPAASLEVVPGAGHLFEEPGALDAVARLAAAWFGRHLVAPAGLALPQPG